MVNMNRRDSSSNMSKARSEGNKVFVSNIDFHCTHQDLKEAFKQVGEVAFVEMIKDNEQKPNKLTAIVRFKNNNMVDEAIKVMNRYELNGRKIVVKDERDVSRDHMNNRGSKRMRDDDHPFERQPPPPAMDGFGANTYGLSMPFLKSLGIELPLVNRIFVANLDYGVNEDMLREVFALAGKVLDVELVKDDSGKSKGYGFIEFDHPIEAVQAISLLHNQSYRDRQMSVQLTRKTRGGRDGGHKLPSGLKSVGMGLGINGAPLKDVKNAVESGSNSLSLLGALPTNSSRMQMDMGGMNQGGMSNNLASGIMSSSMVNNLAAVGGIGANLGRGLMDAPVGLNRLQMGGINTSSNMRGAMNTQQSFGSNFSNGGSNARNSNVLQITNLPNDYTWKDLQSLCTPFGDVAFAKITARGIGAVQFDNEQSARRASDMLDGQRFEGCFLQTRLV